MGTSPTTFRKAQAAEKMPEPDRDKMDFGCGLSLGLISPSPPHGQDTRGCHYIHLHGRGTNANGKTAGRTPLVGASALHGVSGLMSGSHLGSTLGSGKSCPDPGRLSTFGVSGLYPCRRLTYRGACVTHASTEPAARQMFTQCFTGVGDPRLRAHNFAGTQNRDAARTDDHAVTRRGCRTQD